MLPNATLARLRAEGRIGLLRRLHFNLIDGTAPTAEDMKRAGLSDRCDAPTTQEGGIVIGLDARTRELAEELAAATVARIAAEERSERAAAALAEHVETHHGAAGRDMLTAVLSFFVGILVGLLLRRPPTDPPAGTGRAERVEWKIGPVSEG